MAVRKLRTALSTVSAPSIVTVPDSETKFERMMREAREAVAQHAYYLSQQHGFTPGKDLEDWFRAESELFRAVPIEIAENEDELRMLAEVPGYAAEDIDIHLEPKRLVIRGKAETEHVEEKGNLSYSERAGREIFRAVHLPVQVDPEKASAVVHEGVLEVTLPKAQIAKGKHVQVQAA